MAGWLVCGEKFGEQSLLFPQLLTDFSGTWTNNDVPDIFFMFGLVGSMLWFNKYLFRQKRQSNRSCL